MTVLTIVALASLQDFPEPLPLRPTAHPIPAAAIPGWRDQGSMADAAPHPGTRLVKA